MTKIKICGIRTLDDALAAVDAGADMLGFNFYKKSPRYIEVGMCRGITAAIRGRAYVRFVGVFVNASVAEINAIVGTCGLNLIQLHGDETSEMFAQLTPKAFKAFRGTADVGTNTRMIRDGEPALLVDAAVKGLYGGSGVTADWSGAAELAQRYPLLLAGGLTPENVAEAVGRVKPWGVDVASGVESTPGKKDPSKMKMFVKAIR